MSCVLPTIEKALDEYEVMMRDDTPPNLRLDFSYGEPTILTSPDWILKRKWLHSQRFVCCEPAVHAWSWLDNVVIPTILVLQALITKKTLSSMELLVSYHCGDIYLNLKEDKPEDTGIKEFFNNTVKIPYTTAQRYMSFASLVKAYPRLLVCNLAFTSVMQHYSSICDRIKIIFHLQRN